MAELVLSLCELVEAEGRLLRANIQRTGTGCLLAAIGLLFLGGALALLTSSIYCSLRYVMSVPVALLCLSGICAVFGCIMVWFAKPRPKKSKNRRVSQNDKA